MVERPNEIIQAYVDVWNDQNPDSVNHYFEIREQFNQTSDPKLFLYLLARCVKGAVRYNSDGLFNQSPDQRCKGTHPDKMRKNIEGISGLLQGKCQFTHVDYRDVLAIAKRSDFIYMDQSYQGVCGTRDSRYFSGMQFDDFVASIDDLNRREIAFAISYDGRLGTKTFGSPLPEELGLQKIEIEVGRSSQATLLGREDITIESLYLSPNLKRGRFSELESYISKAPKQLTLLEKYGQFSAVTR